MREASCRKRQQGHVEARVEFSESELTPATTSEGEVWLLRRDRICAMKSEVRRCWVDSTVPWQGSRGLSEVRARFVPCGKSEDGNTST